MKTSLLFVMMIGVSAYACVRTTTMPVSVRSVPQHTVVPDAAVVDEELVNKDRIQKEYDAKLKEEKDYNDSVERIERHMSDEYLQYQMCLSTHKKDKDVCKKVLAEFCSVDIVVDTRGGTHNKRYCKQLDKR